MVHELEKSGHSLWFCHHNIQRHFSIPVYNDFRLWCIFICYIDFFFAFLIIPKISNYEVSEEYQPFHVLLVWLLKPSISSCGGSSWRLLTNRRLGSIQSCTLLQLSCSCGHRVVSCCLQIPSSGNRNTYNFRKDIEKTQILYLLISQHRTKSNIISLKFHSR